MPWDLLDRFRDEDTTERRRKTRRLRWRGGRRNIDMKSTMKSESSCDHVWQRYLAQDSLGLWDLGDKCIKCGEITFGERHDGRTVVMQGDRMGKV